jgi:hypothetical protein
MDYQLKNGKFKLILTKLNNNGKQFQQSFRKTERTNIVQQLRKYEPANEFIALKIAVELTQSDNRAHQVYKHPQKVHLQDYPYKLNR